jgi:sec-independent protein translocase protein TatC
MKGFLRDRVRRPDHGGAAEMPFLDHLEELRWRIVWSVGALIASTMVGLVIVFHFDVLRLLIIPIEPLLEGQKLNYLSPTDPIIVTFKLAVLIGFLLAFPVIAYQVWSFISPALNRKEKRAIVPAFYAGLVLFMVGVALGYFLALPLALDFMMGIQTESLQQNITIGPYSAFVMKLLFVFGMVFELPVILVALGAVGLTSTRFLRAKRRFAIAAFAIGASLLTPADMITTVALWIPLILLYEVSILLVAVIEKRRQRSLARDHDTDALPEAG